MSWAKVGAKCVCIRTATDANRIPGAVYPVIGRVYTIRKIVITTIGPGKGEPSILLEELVNDPSINVRLFPGINSDLEASMPIDAFRPLVTKTIEDDIALFKRIADTVPRLEDAE